MALSMHQASVPVFLQGLAALARILDKASAHAAARNLDPGVLLQARLAPDMFPFSRQVQVAADAAKGAAARLAGVAVPAMPDTETSFEELRARLDKTIAFVRTCEASRIDGSEDRDITVPGRGSRVQGPGLPAALYPAELLLPPRHRLRDPPPQRRGDRQARLPWPAAVETGPGVLAQVHR